MKKWFKKLQVKIAGWLQGKINTFLAKANNNTFHELMATIQANRLANLQLQQTQCRHLAGGSIFSEEADIASRTSIVWHELNTGERIGICTNCQREFFPSDPDYAVWVKRASFNKLSRAGRKDTKLKAEPYLIRFTDPPTQVSIPMPPYKEIEIDPWLLDENGNRDEFTIVDFSFEKQPQDIAEEVA